MSAGLTPESLLADIEARLAAITAEQQRLAVEKMHLRDLTVPLRMGVLSAEAALVALTAQGVRLRGLRLQPPRARRTTRGAP